MRFEILGEISEVETFATGPRIREFTRLRKVYGRVAGVNARELLAFDWRWLYDQAELHYEASGIGRKEFKIKDLL